MNIEELTTLREKLLTAEDIEEPWHYFMDNFGDQQEFHSYGRPTDSAFLQEVIEGVLKKLTSEPVTVLQFTLTEISKYSFYHGACLLDGAVMVLFYFKDADTGLFMLMTGGAGSRGLYGRFTCLGNDEGSPGFFSGPGSRYSH